MIRASGSGALVILPVLNEIQHIEPLFKGIHDQLAPEPYTLLIIDGGSTDGTVAAVEQLRELHPEHVELIQKEKRGRGSKRGEALYAGLNWGLAHGDYDVFIEMDGDLSHRPCEIRRGIQLIRDEGHDVAIASKYVAGGRVLNRPFGRRMVSRVSSYLVRLLLSWRIKDYSNGYRFYTREAAQVLACTRITYGSPIYLTEAMGIWLSKRMRIVEFASTYIGRNEGLSKLRFVDLAKALLAVFEICFRYRLRGFRRNDSFELTASTDEAAGVSKSSKPIPVQAATFAKSR